MKFAIITADTAIYQGIQEDVASDAVAAILEETGEEVVYQKAVPSDRKVISTILERMADAQIADVILVTGGNGCCLGDVTPEATLDVIDRRLPGIPEQMRNHMMTISKHAMLNRSEAGIRGNVLIVGLPGKEFAATASIKYLLSELIHCKGLIDSTN